MKFRSQFQFPRFFSGGEAAEPVEKEGWVEFTLYMYIEIFRDRDSLNMIWDK